MSFVPSAVLGIFLCWVSFNFIVKTPPEANVRICTLQTRKRRLRVRKMPPPHVINGLRGLLWAFLTSVSCVAPGDLFLPSPALFLLSCPQRPRQHLFPDPLWSLSLLTLTVTFCPTHPLPLYLPIPMGRPGPAGVCYSCTPVFLSR